MLTSAGYTVCEDIFVAFSPERVDPGNSVYGTPEHAERGGERLGSGQHPVTPWHVTILIVRS
jgi:UDP-N-acetyl-D-mannosaminuronate dehydrogenase